MLEIRSAFAAACLTLIATTATALPLTPASYDMRNGNGQANGGTFNYWDLAYSGAGATNVDGAPLSGGMGDLTDGVVAGANWFDVENGAGTGPYVGWLACTSPTCVANPTITFRFTPGPLETFVYNSVTLHLDDANGNGGVQLPDSVAVSINGAPAVITPVVDPIGDAPLAVTIDLGGILGDPAGDTVAIQLIQKDQWVFLSEVAFSGDIIIRDDFGVPAPASLALLGAALIALGSARRR
ncbi:MAG: PEP-CTERM sorting domain-containing protein [Alphaproteobacteria bacterium]|nr:PEP-CTERM sorting domain-containing protein [Alphaproteobacteria bacterium]